MRAYGGIRAYNAHTQAELEEVAHSAAAREMDKRYAFAKGVPSKVRDACWKAAQTEIARQYPSLKRGDQNSQGLIDKEYERRIILYKQKREAREAIADQQAKRALELAEADRVSRELGQRLAQADRELIAAETSVQPRSPVLRIPDSDVDDWEAHPLAGGATSSGKPCEVKGKERAVSSNNTAISASVCVGTERTATSDCTVGTEPVATKDGITEPEGHPTTVEFKPIHGHPILADSRRAGDVTLRQRGEIECQCYLERNPSGRAAVMDLGSGAAGVKASVKAMRAYAGKNDMYFHCCFPIACTADLNREAALCGVDETINWIQHTGCPMLTKVNVCRHSAAECDCFSFYDHRYVMTVHSSYYFNALDWANVFRYVDIVHGFFHVPTVMERGVPVCDPEFVWRRTESAHTVSWSQRLKAALRTHVLGVDDTVVFEPLRSHGTTYVHLDPRVELEAGGFHLGGWWRDRLSAATNQLLPLAATVACQALGLALGGAELVSAVKNRDPGALVRAGSAIGMGFLPTAAMRFEHVNRTAAHGFQPARTVRIVNNTAVECKGEEIAHYFDYRVGPPCTLEPRHMRSYRPNVKLATELASTRVASTKSAEVVERIIAARILRESLPEDVAIDTITESRSIADRVLPKNEVASSSTSPLPPERKGQPFAWATSLAGNLRWVSGRKHPTSRTIECAALGCALVYAQLKLYRTVWVHTLPALVCLTSPAQLAASVRRYLEQHLRPPAVSPNALPTRLSL